MASPPGFGRSISFQSRMSTSREEMIDETVSSTSITPMIASSSSSLLLQPSTNNQLSIVNTTQTQARSARSRTRSVGGADGQRNLLSHGNEALIAEHSRGPGTPDFTLGELGVPSTFVNKREGAGIKRNRALTGECVRQEKESLAQTRARAFINEIYPL